MLIGRTNAEAEGPILWLPDVKSQLMGKTLMLGKIEGRRRVRQRMRSLDPMDMSLSKPREMVRDQEAWYAAVHRVVKRRTQLGNRTRSHPTSLPLCTPIHKESQMLFRVIPAAAAAKSLQSCPTLCDPRDGSPPGSAVSGILQARTLKWVAISYSSAWK